MKKLLFLITFLILGNVVIAISFAFAYFYYSISSSFNFPAIFAIPYCCVFLMFGIAWCMDIADWLDKIFKIEDIEPYVNPKEKPLPRVRLNFAEVKEL